MKKKITAIILSGAAMLLVLSACSFGEGKPWGYDEDQPSHTAAVTSKPAETGDDASEAPTVSGEETVSDSEVPTESGEGTENAGAVGEKAQAVAELAKSLIGTEFAMGGTGPDQFDNSGFVYYCFKQNGINVPRLTKDIAAAGTEVGRDQVLPGDVVVFSHEVGGGAGFVGIYIGDGKFISCNNEKSPTKEQNFGSDYWTQRFICGRRFA